MERRMQLETEMKKIGLSEEAQCQMRRMLSQKESNYIRLKRAKMDKAMFVKIKGMHHNYTADFTTTMTPLLTNLFMSSYWSRSIW